MGKISVRHATDVPARLTKDVTPPERAATLSPGDLNTRVARYYPNDGESLNFIRVNVEPNDEIQQHAHTSAEVIYVLEGEIHLGAQVARPGTAVFIDEYTLYSFRAGPQGCTFLNFRGVPTVGYLTKEEYLAHRAGNGTTAWDPSAVPSNR